SRISRPHAAIESLEDRRLLSAAWTSLAAPQPAARATPQRAARLTATPARSSFGSATLPGTIQAENFDTGGEGVAFHDTTKPNEGGVYRTDRPDLYAIKGTSNYAV